MGLGGEVEADVAGEEGEDDRDRQDQEHDREQHSLGIRKVSPRCWAAGDVSSTSTKEIEL